MGIVNVTPDSFSDGGHWLDHDRAVAQALQLADDGADILDIGGESTRPGADPAPLDEELRRVIPVVAAIRERCELPISIDTYKADVARQALAAGATIINDISGLQFDPRMIDVCAGSDCGVICMHIQGTPQTMQIDPRYDNVVTDVIQFFRDRLGVLAAAGIAAERIGDDPGIGFGKTAQHNIDLLAHVAELRGLGRPVLIGHSRKGFLKKLLNRPVDERLSGTIGVAIAAAMQRVDILRVHDIAAVRDALTAWQAVADRIER
ncbi:MAG: dihydropteroate synthase [Planctomycetaceae bacterium]|nr:dihydropteroate synthase [Planctomycetaceae bacterium]